MITEEMNRQLTQTGPGTPMGNLLRRYWQPIGTRVELERDPVQPVRLLGENLTLFRIAQGPGAGGEGTAARPSQAPTPDPQPPTPVRYGLIAERCAHRGLSLAYGVPRDNGLRCAYHGWTYDPEGRVVDMPFEPACLPLRITAYPVQELGGLIWAYLGPEPRPLLPRWEIFVREDLAKAVSFKLLPCNWLQCMENAMDPVHFEHLHGHYWSYFNRKHGVGRPATAARHLKIDFDVFEFGAYKRRLLEGQAEDSDDWTVGHPMVFPNMVVVPSGLTPGYQIRVPVDDTTTIHVIYNGKAKGEGRQGPLQVERLSLTYDEAGLVLPDSPIGQDEMAWIGQGAMSPRPGEHLATSDAGIALYRRLLLENIERVERGEDPMGLIRDEAVNWPHIALRGERATGKTGESVAAAEGFR
jgi:5,5'-dehydrodivanillate O-demethylase